MELEITTTPRETLVWASTSQAADLLRTRLKGAGCLVRDADPWELEQHGLIPDGERREFDPARILNVEIGGQANASLQALVDDGHTLTWHRWQRNPGRKVWGVAVAARRGRASLKKAETATHFGITVRTSRELGLRMSRDTYARINKRSSFYWKREDNPRLWDRLDDLFEDAGHRIYTDDWCAALQQQALVNFDLNMAHFSALDRAEFDDALQRAVASQRGMTEVTDLTRWGGVPGLYILVLDEYRQAYVGVANAAGGIMARIRQHWARSMPLDRLVFGETDSSILAIDSFRALDTTRIFAVKTTRSFDEENPLLEQFPPKFMLNRIRGGNDVVHLAGLLGVGAIMRRREFVAPVEPPLDPSP